MFNGSFKNISKKDQRKPLKWDKKEGSKGVILIVYN